MTRQMIAHNTITRLIDRPDLAVSHDLGHNAWVEVREDGGLTFEGTETSHWTVYSNSGAAPLVADEDIPVFPYAGG